MIETQMWQQALDFFISAFAELTILFFIISLIVSAINLYLPDEKIKRLLSGNKGYTVAMGLGALTPFCSCSTLPLLAGLLKARAAFGPLMAFLITSPLLNPFVISLFWITFSPMITLVYSVSVITIAALSGMILQRFQFERYIRPELLGESEPASSCCSAPTKTTNCAKPETDANSCSPSPVAVNNCNTPSCSPASPTQKTNNVKKLLNGTTKQLREMLPYMVIGVAVGAFLHGFVPISAFERLSTMNPFLLIPIAALMGIFLYVRASTMIPIAASMIAKGLSVGAVISLTIAGAGASLPEMIMLKKMFRTPLLITFIFLVLSTAIITGTVIELLAVGV